MTPSTSVETLEPEQRHALETLLVRLADDEFVIAERYTEWQVRAPTLESDLALANIAQDELGHARLWYDVLTELGHDEPTLLYERDPSDFRHGTLCELPFEEGDWADAIVRSYLYDVAEGIRLEALAESSYPSITDRVPKIAAEEEYHRDHAVTWLERLASEADGHERVQSAVERLIPHAMTLFEPAMAPSFGRDLPAYDPATIESILVDEGFRPVPLDELSDRWLDEVSTTLAELDVSVSAADLPDATGRNGTHTDDWYDLYDDFTHTYRDLGRTDTTRIMPEPDDG